MDFGLFNLVNRRSPEQGVPEMLHQTAEQVRAAEAAGFGVAWFAEHHFSNYSLTPSPLLMIAHCAAVTHRIRLGSAVVLTPLYNPARLLGEIAYTDCLSDGRLILGVGSGYQAHELARFNLPLSESREASDEMLEIIERAFTTGEVEYDGRHFKMPHTEISVRPVQRPHPEIWLAGNSPASQQRAAQSDYVLYASGFGRGIENLVEVKQGAETCWAEAGRDPASVRFATMRYCFVTDDRAEALAFGENARFQLRLSRYLRKGQLSIPDGFLPEEPFEGEMTPEELVEWNPVGSPEVVAEKLAAEIAAVDPIHVGLQMVVGNVSHRGAMRSIERFGSEVVPLIEKAVGPLGEAGTRAGRPLARAVG